MTWLPPYDAVLEASVIAALCVHPWWIGDLSADDLYTPAWRRAVEVVGELAPVLPFRPELPRTSRIIAVVVAMAAGVPIAEMESWVERASCNVKRDAALLRQLAETRARMAALVDELDVLAAS